MMGYKKAELSLQVVVVAVILLVVLVVLTFIFLSNTGYLRQDLSACETRVGDCVTEGTCDGTVSSASCRNENEECCLSGSSIMDRIGGSSEE
ncbi:MAG: hypothetical protein ACMXYF_03735 [Candidatus Woesearchaeota archaeon]